MNSHVAQAASGVVLLLVVLLYMAKSRDVGLYIQNLLLVIFSTFLGFLSVLFFMQTNLIAPDALSHRFSLLWIVCFYPLFSLLLSHCLIKKSYVASFLIGFLVACLAYTAGRYLGLFVFSYPFLQTWSVLGVFSGLSLCLSIKLAKIIEKATTETLAERDANTPLKMLYDGQCPICKREVCMLQKQGSQSKIQFTDISAKNFSPSENNNIAYNVAMSQLHVVDIKGNTLVGIPAFAAIYARCDLLVLSILLRIPLVRKALKPLYSLFAKKRLWLTGRSRP